MKYGSGGTMLMIFRSHPQTPWLTTEVNMLDYSHIMAQLGFAANDGFSLNYMYQEMWARGLMI